MAGKALYCDYPGCRCVYAPGGDWTNKAARLEAARYGWFRGYAGDMGRMVDLCPVHKHEPLPES